VAALTQSYVHGVSGTPLIGDTIGRRFDATAARWPERDALVVCQQGVRWSWAELKARVDDFAAGLLALGLEPGSRIGIWAPNCAEWAIAQFATARAGLILVNINPAYRLAELEYALSKVAGVQVFGVPDAKYGEELCAWIKLAAGEQAAEEDIRAFCRDQIAHHKIPRYIRFVDDFPMTVTGKVQKFIMRETMVGELGLEEQATA
jgi:acyl-CoA synthetase (AMP-forming)/AMP-acid ligase II